MRTVPFGMIPRVTVSTVAFQLGNVPDVVVDDRWIELDLEYIDNSRGVEGEGDFGADYRRQSAFDLPAIDG